MEVEATGYVWAAAYRFVARWTTDRRMCLMVHATVV